jgi:hypothetical protein
MVISPGKNKLNQPGDDHGQNILFDLHEVIQQEDQEKVP